jgi:hypothetical protein
MKLKWKSLHLLSKIGIIVLLIGSVPFFTVMALDALGIITTGNLAHGTGPLVGITFYPSIILIFIGVYLNHQKKKKEILNKNL